MTASVSNPVLEVTAAASDPLVWVLSAYRAGETTQLVALAEALGWPYQIKNLRHRRRGLVPQLGRHASRWGLAADSATLTPPWPAVVITAGLRNEPVARWIKTQSPTTRIVAVGRTWAAHEHFDLIITTPQYRLPQRPNILHNHTTLQYLTPARLAAVRDTWQARVAHLPPPHIAVLVGGSAGPYAFDAFTARRLGEQASDLARQLNGSLLISTSARSGTPATDALAATVTVPHYLYRWQRDDPDNPYIAFLALAEQLIVTGDSIAMLSEACACGKPVSIFSLGEGTWAMAPAPHAAPLPPWSVALSAPRLRAGLYRALMATGPQRLSRDIRLVHQQLRASGRAVWLGEEPLPPPAQGLDDVARAVARVRQWLLS